VRYLDARANDPAPERRLPVDWAAAYLRDQASSSLHVA